MALTLDEILSLRGEITKLEAVCHLLICTVLLFS